MTDRAISPDIPMPAQDAEALALRHARIVKFAGITISFALLIAGWVVLSWHVRPWVPSPTETWNAALRLVQTPKFYDDLLLTWQRLLVAFFAATIFGGVLGLAVGLSKRIEAFFQPLLALALAVPDPVFIIFAILALGTGEVAGSVALVLAIAPFVTNIVRTSVQARDMTLDEMVKIYRLSPQTAFRACLLPQLVPSLVTAARLSFALSWKIVILVEALAQPHGIGAAIYHAFNTLRMRDVFALAILFTIMMQIVERGVLAQIEKRVLRWRQ